MPRIEKDDEGFVMLAADATEADFRFPCIASPKIDGHRIYIKNGVARTRAGKRIANRVTADMLCTSALEGFDGEAVVGPPNAEDTFHVTSSGLRTEKRDPKANYLVFDLHDVDAPFHQRIKMLEERVRKLPVELRERVIPVTQRECTSLDELLAFEKRCLELGFEGLIVRAPHAYYKNGRSTVREHGMLKLKRFVDTEAVIIGMEEEIDKHGKPKGTCGALICIDLKTEREFRCAGMTRDDKAIFWALGSKAHGVIVTYRYTPAGTKEKPRHPRSPRVRDERDMDAKLVQVAKRLAKSNKFRIGKLTEAA